MHKIDNRTAFYTYNWNFEKISRKYSTKYSHLNYHKTKMKLEQSKLVCNNFTNNNEKRNEILTAVPVQSKLLNYNKKMMLS